MDMNWNFYSYIAKAKDMVKVRRKQKGIKCPNCLQEIYSNHVHDFRTCFCGACYVDGGFDYLRFGWEEAYATPHTILEVTRKVWVLTKRKKRSKK